MVTLTPEQLIVHARVFLGRGKQLPYSIGVPLAMAFERLVAENKQLREKVRELEHVEMEGASL